MRQRASEALLGPVDHLPLSELTRRVIRAALPAIRFEAEEEILDPEPWLFFAQDRHRTVRIGHLCVAGAASLQWQLTRLQKRHDQPLWLLTAVPGTMAIERGLLNYFDCHRAKGRQWFYPVSPLLQVILDLKVVMHAHELMPPDRAALPAAFPGDLH